MAMSQKNLFIDHRIKPHVLSVPSYVQGDMDFLLQNVKGIVPDVKLGALSTFDFFSYFRY